LQLQKVFFGGKNEKKDNNNRFGCDDVFGYPVDRFRVQQERPAQASRSSPSACSLGSSAIGCVGDIG
jgi:hypothetical protein